MGKIFKRRKIILYIDIVYMWKNNEVYFYLELRQKMGILGLKKLMGIIGLKKLKYTLSIPERDMDDEFTLVNKILKEESSFWGDYDKLVITRKFKTN